MGNEKCKEGKKYKRGFVEKGRGKVERQKEEEREKENKEGGSKRYRVKGSENEVVRKEGHREEAR